jgi:cytochrome P450
VGCNPVSLHRSAEIFGHDADDFRPARWLTGGDPTRIRDMERYNLTWGGGARSCPGRNLAQLVLCKVVPTLFREFDIEVVEMPAEDDVKYYFMAMLTGVKVRFLPRSGE